MATAHSKMRRSAKGRIMRGGGAMGYYRRPRFAYIRWKIERIKRWFAQRKMKKLIGR